MDEIPASEFDGRTFDAKEVVQRYRKRVPLPQLQKGLRAHHAQARQELVELINDKYADFVSLSSRMQGVERALKPLRAPLEETGEMTRSLQGKLGTLLGQAAEAHKALAEVRARKDALASYIENARLLDRAKEAAAQRWGNPQESDDVLREHMAQENVARDLRRIGLNLGGSFVTPGASADPSAPGSAELSAEESSPECRAILAETTAFAEEFAGGLRARLQGLVAAARRSWETPVPQGGADGADAPAEGAAGPPPRSDLLAIAHLCRALVTIGKADAAEAVFADVFVGGALRDATACCTAAAEDAQSRAGSGPTVCIGAGAVDLGPFFQAAREALLKEGAPLLWFAARLRGAEAGPGSQESVDSALLAVPSLRLVSSSIAAPVLLHVQQTWPNVFMPAFPDVFAANHGHATSFIAAAQALMTPGEQRAFAQSPALLDFLRRWKTQVYSSLRSKEAMQRLQAAAGERPHGAGAGDGPRKFWLEASGELMRILETTWSDKWYLDALFTKMTHLSLELVARYGKSMRELADSVGGDVAQGPGWDAAAGSWAPTSAPLRTARAAADLAQVSAELGGAAGGASPGSVARLMLARLPGGAAAQAGRPGELVRELLSEAVQGLSPALAALDAALLKHVAAATKPQFGAIRGIPAFYRMLNKPVPTKATPYVDSAVRPILALREAAGKIAPQEAVAGWVRQAVDAAAAEFAAQAAQLLESTHQQEASLRRLGGRGSGGEAQVSDLDKIHVQLCLDVETFAGTAAVLGAPSSPSLAKLAEVVAPIRPTFEAHRPRA